MSLKIESKIEFKQGFVDLAKLEKHLQKLQGEFTEVGYTTQQMHQSEESDDVISMADLATILHEGAPKNRIPPRPFLRGTLQSLTAPTRQRFLRKPFMKYLQSVKNKQVSVDQMLLDLGKIIRKEVQSNFGNQNKLGLRRNAPSTERIKGKNDPLVDSGDLRDAMLVKTSRGGEA